MMKSTWLQRAALPLLDKDRDRVFWEYDFAWADTATLAAACDVGASLVEDLLDSDILSAGINLAERELSVG